MSISIVVPVFNEAGNILKLFNQISNNISKIKETLIIYDFKEDNTLPVIDANIHQYRNLKIKLVKNDISPGVVNALKVGLNTAEGKYILVLMADLSDDLRIVNKMLEKLNNGCDIVCGSRYMKDGKQIGGNIFKKSLSRLAGISLHALTKIQTHDVTNNFKIYRKSILENIEIESKDGFEIAMEITIKAFKKGYKICEIPSTWQERSDGVSNFKLFKWLPSYIRWYFYCLRK